MACEKKLLESEATTGFFVLLGTKGKKETLEWCMKANLIASRYECPRCKKEMRLQERKGTVDGYEWRCRSQSKDNPHDVVRSVRKGTWFSESTLAITIILRLTRYWFGKSMNAFVVNDDLMVTSWWMTIFMNSLHPSQGCIHQRNMTKCKRKVSAF
ncbi:mitotic-spindle organizing protein 2A [Trichonephila clavipes]|nr:mitotic-spindle organizing protein 2A [Trichonephila clavipes]